MSTANAPSLSSGCICRIRAPPPSLGVWWIAGLDLSPHVTIRAALGLLCEPRQRQNRLVALEGEKTTLCTGIGETRRSVWPQQDRQTGEEKPLHCPSIGFVERFGVVGGFRVQPHRNAVLKE